MSTVSPPFVLSLLRGVRPTANGWDACCPAHDDQRPSLSIAVSQDNKVLYQCRSHRCTVEQIAAALGQRLPDILRPTPPGHSGAGL